jgi:hypothetical protein
MFEPNRLRLERLAARYQARLAAAATPDEAAFLREFAELRERVLRPVLEECAEPLRRAGHEPRILLDEGHSQPSIELALGLRGAKASSNRVGFAVIRWEGYPLQILAYLEVRPPPFDLERFARADELTAERVEQMVVDAMEHVITANTP